MSHNTNSVIRAFPPKQITLLILTLLITLTFFAGCQPKEDPLVEFDGEVYISDGIALKSTNYSPTVNTWLDTCNSRTATAISLYVLSYSEPLEDGNYIFHYLIYRRSLTSGTKAAIKTLRNETSEVVEISYVDIGSETDENALTYVCFKGAKKPTLDINYVDSDGISEYRGYVETVSYAPFGIEISQTTTNSKGSVE